MKNYRRHDVQRTKRQCQRPTCVVVVVTCLFGRIHSESKQRLFYDFIEQWKYVGHVWLVR